MKTTMCDVFLLIFSKQFRTEDRLWRDRWPYTAITRITLMDIAATVEWIKWAPRIRNARRILGITNTMTPYRDMSIRMRGKSIRCQQISRRKTIKLSKRKLNPRLSFSLSVDMARTMRTGSGTVEGNETSWEVRTMKINETERRFRRGRLRVSVYTGRITDPLLPDSVATNRKSSIISTSCFVIEFFLWF